MSSPLEEGIKKNAKVSANTREGLSAFPESSLTWCLTQLSKTSTLVDAHSCGLAGSVNEPITGGEKARDADKRLQAGQWRALVAIRTHHIKGDGSRIARYQARGGLPPLLDLLRQPESSRKVLDLALIILANCCTQKGTRQEVRKLDGVSVVVDVLKRNVSVQTVQNRAVRALGNLAMDPEGSAEVHSAGGVPLLLLCLSFSPPPSSPSSLTRTPELCTLKLECAQSAARALVYLSDTPTNRHLLISQGSLPALALFIAPEYPLGLRRASLRALHELTRGCSAECAREVSKSGVLTHLGAFASGEGDQSLVELALKTLANLCTQGCLRPLVGSLGVIQKFAEEVKKDPLKSGVLFKALCLCCREAVNRAKVKESGGLEVLIGFLSAHQNHTLTRFAILACVDFVYDESALEQLQELGLVPLLIKRLVELAKGEELTTGKIDARIISSSPCSELMTSCFDSFDFTPLEGKKEDMSKEQTSGSSSFLSLRSWLVSEGLISSEGELTESSSGTDVVCGSPQSSLSPSLLTPCSELSPALHQPHSSPSTRSKPCRLSSSTPLSAQAAQLKILPESPSSSHPSCTSTLQSEKLPSITKPSIPPLSPLRISSPPRKRLRVSSSTSTSTRYSVVTLDNPSVMSKTPTYHHPYHPEPWAPESPILLLLSRFSHASDPSTSLINTNVFSGLLYYLTQHHDPSGRCFRMLGRLSCNPNCLQALVRTGAVALIRQRLCVSGEEIGNDKGTNGGTERQSEKVKAKIAQLGLGLLSNLRVQSESGFGSGVLTHIMLSGSETDKLYCVLSLPLINSNRVLLKKLLFDSGGLVAALELIGCQSDNDKDNDEDGQFDKCRTFLDGWLHPLEQVSPYNLNFLYLSLLIGCLTSLLANSKVDGKNCGIDCGTRMETASNPMKTTQPQKKQSICPYKEATYDLTFLLDDGTLLLANQEAVAGENGEKDVGSEYFRALLTGGFGEAQRAKGEAILIKDVNSGMLLPVLHYLHGCRLVKGNENEDQRKESKQDANCLVLASLVSGGLGRQQDEMDPYCTEEKEFQKTPLAYVMIGACRFLVPGLQRAAEDLCVDLLFSAVSSVLRTLAKPCFSDDATMTTSRMDVDLVCKDPTHSGPEGSPQVSKSKIPVAQLTGPNIMSKCSKQQSKLQNSPNFKQVPKVVPAAAATSSENGTEGAWLRSLLPQLYWFSQRYSYMRLGQACLAILLRPQGFQPFPLHPSLSVECFLHLVQEADCTEGLRQDILNLVKTALS